jgi:hypothetical protein
MSDFGPPPPDAGGPQYPSQPYPDQPAPASRQSPLAGVGTRLGERLVRRPEPRFGVAMAGAGVALTLFGILLWAGDYWAHGLSGALGSTNRNLLGAALGAAVTVAGYALAVRGRGPLRTAGVVAIGVGWPLTLGFLTLDVTSGPPLPVNLDAIFWVSLIAWLITYLWVPGARGHTFFVFLSSNAFYTYVLFKNISSSTLDIVGVSSGVPRFSGFGTVAAISLCFGLGYYLIAFLLDRRGKHGPATGLVYTAFSATATGILAWSPDLHESGTGVLALVLGLAICWYGGHYGRRITCFAGAIGAVTGIFLLMAQATTNSTAAGISFVVIGVLLVILAAAFATASREPDDMDRTAVVWSR